LAAYRANAGEARTLVLRGGGNFFVMYEGIRDRYGINGWLVS